MAATPEFVRWTLPLACALREETYVTNPEQTERQLRSLRTYSDCIHAGREFEGVCLSASDPTLGFPAQEVLQAYGGAEFVHSQCDPCPLNVLRGRAKSGLAGCYGLLLMGAEQGARLEEAMQRLHICDQIAELFLPTNPGWFGLWARGTLEAPHIALFTRLYAALGKELSPAEGEFVAALQLASQQQTALHVRLYPAGETLPDGWRVHSHCGRCKAPLPERARHCAICGLNAHAEPSRTRKAQGSRPFVPLARFLGAQAANDFLARYAARS